jgi:hypothetical protein
MAASIQFSQKVTVPAHVLFRELHGESVLLNLNSERYFGLDEVGTRILSVVADSASIEEAYQTLAAEYEVQPEELHSDIQKLLSDLLDQNLIEVVDERK